MRMLKRSEISEIRPSKPVKRSKTWVCPFCEKTREKCNHTAILYRGKWIDGCQECYLKSIEEKTMDAFQKKDYQLL